MVTGMKAPRRAATARPAPHAPARGKPIARSDLRAKARRLLVCGVLLGLLAWPCGARAAQAQTTQGFSLSVDQSAAVDAAEAGKTQPEALPIPGLQLGAGLAVVDLKAPALGVRLKGGTPSQTGALLQLDWAGKYLRLGYARQFYRNSLPAKTTLKGNAVDAISFDADQFWGFVGMRPFQVLWVGLGLGWQRRLIRVLQSGQALRDSAESRFMEGVRIELSIGSLFSLQLRAFQDARPGFVNVRTGSLVLAFTAPF